MEPVYRDPRVVGEGPPVDSNTRLVLTVSDTGVQVWRPKRLSADTFAVLVKKVADWVYVKSWSDGDERCGECGGSGRINWLRDSTHEGER